MTHLRTFLTSSGIKQKAMAAELRISRGYMSELVNGDKSPGLDLALNIERLTKGAVPVNAWSKTAEISHQSSPSSAPENAGVS